MVKDMTEGKVGGLLLGFTIPLVLGNLFQLFYNAADSLIVGRFVGTDALAAVGAGSPIMTLAILFINGMCLGASILMGVQFGAGDIEKLKRQASTTMVSGVVFSLVLSVICVILTPQLLRLIKVDEDIMPLAVAYLRVVFGGMIFTFIYNFYANTLRALGDSRGPLIFLVISSVLNIFGDLFFVTMTDLGSTGCAIATVLSQLVCAATCGIYIKKKVEFLNLGRKWFIFDKDLFVTTVNYGWVSATQQASIQFGKVIIMAMVNTMGVSAAAAFTVAGRIDDFAIIPANSIAAAMTALMAQNLGAHKYDRLNEGFKSGMIIEIIYGIATGLICIVFSGGLMRIFSDDASVIELGKTYLGIIGFFYIMPALTNGLQGYFRGIGDLRVTMWSSFMNIGVRVVAAAVLVWGFGFGIGSIAVASFIGWIAMFMYELPILIKTAKRHAYEK